MGLFNLVAWRDTNELGHQTVHHIGIVLRLKRLHIRRQAQLHQFGICDIIESEEVCPRLLDGIAIGFQCIRVNTRQKPSAAVSQTLMQIGMQVIADIAVFPD